MPPYTEASSKTGSKSGKTTFYDRIESLKTDHNLTNVDLSQIAGVGRTEVYRWRQNPPKPEIVSKLAKFFEVTPDYLLFGTELPFVKPQPKAPPRIKSLAERATSKSKAYERDSFYGRLDALKREYELTDDDIASIADTVRPNVSNWRRGSLPRPEVIEKLAAYFKRTPAFLLYGTEPPKVPTEDELGYKLIPEVGFYDSPADRHFGNKWAFPISFLRNELHVRDIDALAVYRPQAEGGGYHFGDSVLVDLNDAKASPAGDFLVWDGLAAVIVHLSIVPPSGREKMKVTISDGHDTRVEDADKVKVLGRVRGLWRVR